MNNARIFLLIAFIVGFAGCKKNTWVRVQPASGGFAIMMPGTPRLETEALETPGGRMQMANYLSTQQTTTWSMGYWDLPYMPNPAVSNRTPEKVLQTAAASFVRKWPQRNVTSAATKIQGYPAWHCSGWDSDASWTSTYDYCLVGKRVFMFGMVSTSDRDRPSSTDIEYFFKSFKVLTNNPAGGK